SHLHLLHTTGTRRGRPRDQLIELGQLQKREPAQPLVRTLIARAEQITDLLEREPHSLRSVNDRQPTKHLTGLPPRSCRTLRNGRQAARLVVADPRGAHPSAPRDLAVAI